MMIDTPVLKNKMMNKIMLLARVMMGGFPLLIPDDPPPKKPNGKEK